MLNTCPDCGQSLRRKRSIRCRPCAQKLAPEYLKSHAKLEGVQMESIERLKKLWSWLPIPPSIGVPSRWTQTGYECLQLNRNCAECTIFKTLGRHWSGFGSQSCKQPFAVQALLNTDESIPATFVRASSRSY